MQIREPAVANQFYPGNSQILKQTVLRYLSLVEIDPEDMDKIWNGTVKGIIAPHAGYMYSCVVAAYGYHLLKNLSRDVKWKVVLIGPSHFIPFNGASPYKDGFWKTPLGNVPVKDIRKELSIGDDDDVFLDVPEAHADEHSLEVQVPFLQLSLDKFVLYPIAVGSIRPDFLAKKLENFVKRDDVIVVVSSDLSHYLSYDEATETDRNTLEGIIEMNIEKVIEQGDACGIKGILTMMFLAEKLAWKPVLLDYRNSGDTAGGKDKVVGYGSVAFC